jgi:predicted DsbA family dithiol-disulfide isomerase
VADAGADPVTVRAAVDGGLASVAVDDSMAAAAEHGVAATPAFSFPGGLVVPGVQPRETLVRWFTRLARRADAAGYPPTDSL